MRFRLWPFVSLSFSLLLLLVVVFAWSVWRKSAEIEKREAAAHRTYQRADDAITNVRFAVYRAALLPNVGAGSESTAEARREMTTLKTLAESAVRRLTTSLNGNLQENLTSLRTALTNFWDLPPATALDSGRDEKAILKRNRQRETVLALAENIDALNEANIHAEDRQIRSEQSALNRFALRALTLLVALILAVAVATSYNLARLEKKSDSERERTAEAEFELRRLSQQLVRVQEEERKTISRELHDEVGQMLTGLRLELGTLAKLQKEDNFQERVDSVKTLAEEALRAVRNISLLLRPSMLDDLGLGPALRWQAKEFSRRIDVPITVDIQGNLDGLPEAHRVCLYRAVQEALTNCAKHAEATRITVVVLQEQDVVTATVQDNGLGFEGKTLRTQGLGLIGMEERVRALQGALSISSEPGKGTTMQLTFPLYAQPVATEQN